MIAAVHLPPAVAVPAAVAVGAVILWYWRRVGAASVPPSRRCIRRASLVVMAGALPVVVVALSFVDPDRSPSLYVAAWFLVLFLLSLVLLAVGLDLINTLRLAREERRQRFIDARAAAARRARGGGP